MIGVAMPPFWLGMLLILVFSVNLRWLPASGFVSFFESPLENLSRMIMPAFAIGAAFAATGVALATATEFLKRVRRGRIRITSSQPRQRDSRAA